MRQARDRLTLDDLLAQARARIRRLDPRSAYEAAANGALIIDIRSAMDRERDGVIPGSLHIPRTVLEWRLDPVSPWRSPYAPDLDQVVLLLCDHGYSSSLAAATLTDLGFTNAGDVVGGFAAWHRTGLPTAAAREHMLAPGERVGMRPPERAPERSLNAQRDSLCPRLSPTTLPRDTDPTPR
jgi:rhodanese-related sulfurtransferase